MSKEICLELISIAEQEVLQIQNSLTIDVTAKFTLFTETIRVLDNNILKNGQKQDQIIFNDILKMGWNLSASILFKGLNKDGFPIVESTKERFFNATSVMYRLGCTILIRRAVDMVFAGFLSVTKKGDTYTFSKTSNSNLQFLDQLEITNLQKLNIKLKKKIGSNYDNWFIDNSDKMNEYEHKTGNFILSNNHEFHSFSQKKIRHLLRELVFPWHTGQGIMTGYKSSYEVEKHYIQKALELVNDWKFEAGIHPKTKVGNITADLLLTTIVMITSLHLKHIDSCLVAAKKHSDISLQQSLTIWSTRSELISNIINLSGLNESIISEIFDLISMQPSDVEMLRGYTTRFMPLLIDIGNGLVLRPVSSIFTNPLFSITAVLEFRTPGFIDNLLMYREEWLRENLYNMFLGTRYKTVNGNVKLKTGNIVDTDLDAVVFDQITGELAIFQIKWQDFHYNDVKKLISKAKNLSESLDNWAHKVNNWINFNGQSKLLQTLRIKSKDNVPISKIYLFALSKNIGRTVGFGYSPTTQNLAVSSWAQFSRNRIEIGPTKNVFEDLFKILKSQENKNFKSKPLPAELFLNKNKFYFKNLWSEYN